jgi:hypothetical protein
MSLDSACDRMLASIGETAAHAIVLERRFEEHSLQALASLIPICVGTAISFVISHSCDLSALRRSEKAEVHGINVDNFTFTGTLILDKTESVTWLQCKEIDAPLIYVSKVHDEHRRSVSSNHVIP